MIQQKVSEIFLMNLQNCALQLHVFQRKEANEQGKKPDEFLNSESFSYLNIIKKIN